MKMTMQVRKMVEAANEHLRENHIKDESDTIFNVTSWLLLKGKCYHGFNYFTEEGYLSGGKNEKFDHLEFYVY